MYLTFGELIGSEAYILGILSCILVLADYKVLILISGIVELL